VAVSLVRWPLLAVAVMVVLAVLYRYGPSRDKPQWTWVSWGAVVATVLWLITSILFSVYVANFGSYNETYGSLGVVVVFLMWLYLSAYIVLIGAELNAEMEHQTTRDTTRGAEQPMGRRGAQKADTVGESP
jgi:membrane protein